MKRALILCDITVIVAVLIESSVTSLLTQTADKVDDQRVIASEAEKQAPPERVVLRRLNHTEYQNTVRDLLVRRPARVL